MLKNLVRRSSKLISSGKNMMGNSSSQSERLRSMDDSSRTASGTRRSTPQQEETLLDRLGGMPLLASVVSEFCRRVCADSTLQQFFEGVDIRVLSAHQRRFFAVAFGGKVPENVHDIVKRKHRHLFRRGLNETHFDRVAQHLVGVLTCRGFNEAIIHEAVGSIAVLRTVFEQGAAEYNINQASHSDAGSSVVLCVQ